MIIHLEDPTKYNQEVKIWTGTTRRALKSNIIRMTGKGKEGSYSNVITKHTHLKLAENLRGNTRKDFGEIDQVSYGFPQHGVFLQKGVGRGYQMIGGKVVRVAKSPGKFSRFPKDWFNAELDRRVPKLADIVATHRADAAMNATRMKIN